MPMTKITIHVNIITDPPSTTETFCKEASFEVFYQGSFFGEFRYDFHTFFTNQFFGVTVVCHVELLFGEFHHLDQSVGVDVDGFDRCSPFLQKPKYGTHNLVKKCVFQKKRKKVGYHTPLISI